MKGHNESFRVIEKYWKIIDITNISFLDKLIKTFNRIYSLNIFKRKFLVELFLLWNIPFFIDNEFKTILNIKKLKNKN